MNTAEHLVRKFFNRVWNPPHDLSAIDELMTTTYRTTTAGSVVEGRETFKDWVRSMQHLVQDATNEHLEIITNASGDRVVSRWVTRGYNNGLSGLPAAGKSIEFSGIAIRRAEGGRLAACWIERSAYGL